MTFEIILSQYLGTEEVMEYKYWEKLRQVVALSSLSFFFSWGFCSAAMYQ